MTAATKRGKKALATRATLMNAALEIMSRKGFTAATIDEIAKEAGVSKGLAYYHFKNKIELAEDILDQGVHELVESFEAAKDSSAQDSGLGALLTAFCEACVDDCRFARFYLSAVWCEDGLRSQRVREIEAQLVGSIAQRIVACNGVDEETAEFAAVEVIALVFTAAARYFGSATQNTAIDKASFTRNVVGFAAAALSTDVQVPQDSGNVSEALDKAPQASAAVVVDDTLNEPEPQPEPEPEPEPAPGPGPESEPKPEPDPVPEPKSEPEPKPEPDPVPEPKSEPEPKPELEPVPEPEPEPKPELEPAPEPEPESAPAPEPEQTPKPKARKKKAPQVDPGQESLFSFF